jgi:hypothetical protein
MSALVATARYEFRMQVRKRSMWFVTGGSVLLLLLLTSSLIRDLIDGSDPKGTMVTVAFQANLLLLIGYGCLLADRLIRDDHLHVAPVLDATPARPATRLIGKYLGACSAAGTPIAVVYFGVALAYAVKTGEPVALPWALALFGTVIVPALLLVGAWAFAVPLLMPAPLFRVLFVGYWFWSMIDPALLPTPGRTLVDPHGGYPIQVLFGYHGPNGNITWAGPTPGAALNVLRPDPSPAVAWLSIGVLLALAVAALYAAHALRARTAR